MGSGNSDAGVEIAEGYNKWSSQLWSALKNIDSPKNTMVKIAKISEEPDEGRYYFF